MSEPRSPLDRRASLRVTTNPRRHPRMHPRPRPLAVASLIVFAIAASSSKAQTVVNSSTTSQTLSTDTAYRVDAGTTITTDIGNALNVVGIAPVTLSNAGTIVSSTDNVAAAVNFGVEGSISNATTGALLGLTYGVGFFGGGASNNVVNSGDISARVSHAIGYEGTSGGLVDNFGTLNGARAGAIGTTSDGIFLNSSGNVTINNHVGASISSGIGDQTYGFGIAINSGTAVINNDGNITGFREAIQSVTPLATTITNSATGSITSMRGSGILLAAGTSTIANSGTISSPSTAVFVGANASASVTNSATGNITSLLGTGVELSSGSTLVNNGLITSKLGSAVVLSGDNNSVTLGTGSTLTGGKNVAIDSIGKGNRLILTGTGTENGNATASTGNGLASFASTAGSVWTFSGDVALGGLTASALDVAGDLTLGGTVSQNGGGGTAIATGATLTLGTGGAGGSVTGDIANAGTLRFNRSDNSILGGAISGAGSLIQAGSGVTILTGTGSTQSSVNVNAGMLAFAQTGVFNATGNYTTAQGAATSLAGRSQLNVGGTFAMNGTFDSIASVTAPVVTASTATIGPGATVNIAGYSASPTASATELVSTAFTEIHTTAPGGLTGAFATTRIGGSTTAPDFLTLTSIYTPQDYIVGLGLTWYASHGSIPQTANGVFTLTDAADSFEMDAVLADQPANAATNWDGKTLTKAGAGTLQLSQANTYSGATLVEGGTLRAGAGNVIADSAQLSIANGAAFDLNGFDQRVNNLVGAGSVTLGGATLTANNTSDTAFDGVISGNGNLDKTGSSTLTLSSNHSYSGATLVSSGALVLVNGAQLASTTQVTVAPGAIFGGYGGTHGDVTNNGVLAVADAAPGWSGGPAGQFVIGGSLVNGGAIVMGSPVPASTLSVAGDYSGNNGQLILNTTLGGDNAATDRLVVHGSTSGQTAVTVVNAGGAGAATNNGIEIVQVDGASNGVFSLNGRVVAGPYEYALFKGGVSTPDDGDWYLRSSSNAPSPSPLPRPEPGGYLGNQSAARNMFSMTLHNRAGSIDPYVVQGVNDEHGNQTTAWARAEGNHTDANAASGRIDESTDTAVFQAGIDLLNRVENGHRWQAGIMAGYGSATTDSSAPGNPASARGSVNGASVGVYATWHRNANAPDGPYFDTWLQYGHFDNSVKGALLNGESYTSQLFAKSVEGGWAIPIAQTATGPLLIEPQAQLIFSNYRADDHIETNGTLVHTDTVNALTTRLGVRFFHAPSSDTAPQWQPYAEVNWWHDTNVDAIAFNNVVVSQDGPRNRMELKIGAQGQIAKRWRVWGNLGYQQGDGGYRVVEGVLGARYIW